MQKKNRMMKVFLLLLVFFAGSHTVAYADNISSVKDWYEPVESEEDEEKAPQQNNVIENENTASNSTVGITIVDIIKMILATIFVIALIYFLLRFINKKSNVYSSTQLVQNMGGSSLGANRSIQIVKVGDRVLILGVGENVNLLKEIDDQEEARHIIREYNNKMDQLALPSDIVTKVIKKAKSLGNQDKKQESAEFQTILKDKLDNMSKERKKVFDQLEKKGTDKQ